MATVTIATRSLKKGKAYVIHFNRPGIRAGRNTTRRYRRKDLAQEEANRLRTLLDSGRLPTKEISATEAASPCPLLGKLPCCVGTNGTESSGEGKISQASHAGYGYLPGPGPEGDGSTPCSMTSRRRPFEITASASPNRPRRSLWPRAKKARTATCWRTADCLSSSKCSHMAAKQGLIEKDIARDIPYSVGEGQ